MNLFLALVIAEFVLFALPILVMFARLSFHYSRLFDASPDLATAFQSKFSGTASAAPGTRPDNPYRPVEQIKYLTKARQAFTDNPQVHALLNTVIWDLRLTFAWLVTGGILGLATVIALYS